MKDFLFMRAEDSYSSPDCVIYNTIGSQFVCGSPETGGANEAGSGMQDNDGNTYNY